MSPTLTELWCTALYRFLSRSTYWREKESNYPKIPKSCTGLSCGNSSLNEKQVLMDDKMNNNTVEHSVACIPAVFILRGLKTFFSWKIWILQSFIYFCKELAYELTLHLVKLLIFYSTFTWILYLWKSFSLLSASKLYLPLHATAVHLFRRAIKVPKSKQMVQVLPVR